MGVEQSADVRSATAPDYDDIVRVIQLYVDGYNGVIGKLREAFHEDAWIFFTDRRGGLHRGLLADAFKAWPTEPGHAIVGRIISVTQAGDIASVLLGFDDTNDLSGGWVDLHALIRIDGIWKITNKTATHCSRASWAAPETMGRSLRSALPE